MRKPLTGEPYAGKPHVRFGGRGDESLLYPYLRTPFADNCFSGLDFAEILVVAVAFVERGHNAGEQ
jgi:hypothetical protein